MMLRDDLKDVDADITLDAIDRFKAVRFGRIARVGKMQIYISTLHLQLGMGVSMVLWGRGGSVVEGGKRVVIGHTARGG